MITPDALIEKFRYALDNKWGYIMGTAGDEWTQKKQNAKVSYMVKTYGEDWKKNADAKKDRYYQAALNGGKWIGHKVADCSGLFYWAFKQLGGYMYHGSNTMYKSYCTEKGKLTDSLKKSLVPGTAVFTGDESKHDHVGLYVGNGKVIEASGTVAGVCVSNLSAGKWTYYGKLKGVDYPASEGQEQASDSSDDKSYGTSLPTLKKGDKGEYVTLLQTKLKNQGYDLGKYGVDGDFGSATQAAVKKFQQEHGLPVDGIVGADTWRALETAVKTTLYTVVIPHLSEKQADTVIALYKGAYKEVEKG